MVDIQVNGFAGHDLQGTAATEDATVGVVRELWKNGVTSFCPTVISAPVDSVEASVRAVAKACASDSLVRDSVAGIHLEGPFICPDDGPRGAHDRHHVRPPDWNVLEGWRRAAGGLLRIVTMSPHWPDSAAFIRRCAAEGLVVAVGHTGAFPAQIREAVEAGARLSTHLGNGSHPLLPRHRNYIWEQLADDRLWASLIADGFHLPDSVLKVFLRVKGRRAVLASDSVRLAGLPPGTYDAFATGRVVLTAEGRLHLERDPDLLAGSALPLVAGVSRLVASGLCGLAEAWERASVLPAELLGIPQAGGLAEGAPADIVVFARRGGRVEVIRTYKRGRIVHDAEGRDASAGS